MPRMPRVRTGRRWEPSFSHCREASQPPAWQPKPCRRSRHLRISCAAPPPPRRPRRDARTFRSRAPDADAALTRRRPPGRDFTRSARGDRRLPSCRGCPGCEPGGAGNRAFHTVGKPRSRRPGSRSRVADPGIYGYLARRRRHPGVPVATLALSAVALQTLTLRLLGADRRELDFTRSARGDRRLPSCRGCPGCEPGGAGNRAFHTVGKPRSRRPGSRSRVADPGIHGYLARRRRHPGVPVATLALFAVALQTLTLRLLGASRLDETSPVVREAIAAYRHAADAPGANREALGTELFTLSGSLAAAGLAGRKPCRRSRHPRISCAAPPSPPASPSRRAPYSPRCYIHKPSVSSQSTAERKPSPPPRRQSCSIGRLLPKIPRPSALQLAAVEQLAATLRP